MKEPFLKQPTISVLLFHIKNATRVAGELNITIETQPLKTAMPQGGYAKQPM